MPPLPPANQVGHNVLGAEEGSPQVYFQHPVPVVRGHAQQQAVAGDSGVVDQDVYAAPLVNNLLYQGFGFPLFGYVPSHHRRLAAGLDNGVYDLEGGFSGGLVIHRNPGSLLGQPAGNHRSYPPRGPRHQCHLLFQASRRHYRESPVRPLRLISASSSRMLSSRPIST